MANKTPFQEALEQIENVIKFKKCWKCGCNQGAIKGIEKELHKLTSEDRKLIDPLIKKSKSTFLPIEYDCLGCKTCFPGDMGNTLAKAYPELELEPDSRASEKIFVKERDGFPPFPGNYEVLRYEAPVAICTLNSRELISPISKSGASAISIVGSLNTENLGIERVIKNTISNPNIRYFILCGQDSTQAIGHLPGQSLVSLFQNGVDAAGKIIGAKGKRPILKNIDIASIEQFRAQVELANMIGCEVASNVIEMSAFCAKKNPGVYQGAGASVATIAKIKALPPGPLKLDPNGYFIIFPEVAKKTITVEHYHNSGVLNCIVEGDAIADIYTTILEKGLVSRLDHACYLGKELARAEESLRGGKTYVQDKAQDELENKKIGCGPKGCC